MRLHCAAHLEFVKTEDGITTFRAVKGDVLSLIVNLRPPLERSPGVLRRGGPALCMRGGVHTA